MAGTLESTTGRGVSPLSPPKRSLLSRLSLGHVIMIVAGLAAFLLVFSVLRSRDETFKIAVAVADLRAGTVVTEEAFQFAEVGATDPSVLGTFLNPDDVARAIEDRWVVTRTIDAGDPVRISDFRTEAVPEELRAMSIPIDVGHAVAGSIRVGDLIDVIVVRKGVASYVNTGIEVLDVNLADARFGSGFSVTVAVDGPGSLRIASALRDGGLEIVRATGAVEVDPQDQYDPSGEPDGAPADPETG